MTAEGWEKRCNGGPMRGGSLMLGCSLSTLRLFRATCRRIISKHSLCRWVLEVVIRQSTINIGRKLKISVLRRNNSCKNENPCTSGVRSENKQEHWRTIYLFPPLSLHSPGTPQVLMWEYCGIADGKIGGWGCFPPKTPTQETAWQFTPEKFPQQEWGCLITWC